MHQTEEKKIKDLKGHELDTFSGQGMLQLFQKETMANSDGKLPHFPPPTYTPRRVGQHTHLYPLPPCTPLPLSLISPAQPPCTGGRTVPDSPPSLAPAPRPSLTGLHAMYCQDLAIQSLRDRLGTSSTGSSPSSRRDPSGERAGQSLRTPPWPPCRAPGPAAGKCSSRPPSLRKLSQSSEKKKKLVQQKIHFKNNLPKQKTPPRTPRTTPGTETKSMTSPTATSSDAGRCTPGLDSGRSRCPSTFTYFEKLC